MVGSAARTRVSSVTLPSLSRGTVCGCGISASQMSHVLRCLRASPQPHNQTHHPFPDRSKIHTTRYTHTREQARTVEVHADKDALALDVHLFGQRREGLLACVGVGARLDLSRA